MSIQIDASLLSFSNEEHNSESVQAKNDEVVVSIELPSENIFIERKNLLISEYEYARSGDEPGLVLIFNQENFKHEDSRKGSTRDVNEIISCMSRLGYNIDREKIYNDLTSGQIQQKIKDIVAQDLSQVNSLVVFFLSHGNDLNKIYSFEGDLNTSEIWSQFENCKDLKDKPKLFIFQACKGSRHSKVVTNDPKEIDLVSNQTFQQNFIGPDSVVVFSSTEGNVAFRDSNTGTWFIQELCKNFLAYGRRDDVLSLIMRTTKCVCRNYYHIKGDELMKQVPIFISTLTKKFYLNRSKDRNIYLHMLGEQARIKVAIQQLEEKVEYLLKDKKDNNK